MVSVASLRANAYPTFPWRPARLITGAMRPMRATSTVRVYRACLQLDFWGKWVKLQRRRMINFLSSFINRFISNFRTKDVVYLLDLTLGCSSGQTPRVTTTTSAPCALAQTLLPTSLHCGIRPPSNPMLAVPNAHQCRRQYRASGELCQNHGQVVLVLLDLPSPCLAY